jgi:hypothetical protein
MESKSPTPAEKHQARIEKARQELGWMKARYDSTAAVSPAIYFVMKELETDIAWNEHALGNWRPIGDAAMQVVRQLKQKQNTTR